ncbi:MULTISPECIES: ATP-dependent nuclease [Rhodococcus erythropolis group]|uniref:ATP-dependent nuclease n=1 Tax=Rhodococcus erythropolis TaxID=1833 RepID=UPI001E419ABB|nr:MULTISPECIES: AAA family ATPase [Rhodococcus erythropolis group]
MKQGSQVASADQSHLDGIELRLSAVKIVGFRGLDVEIPFAGPLCLITGANNAGKSSVIDALRAVVLPFSGQNGKHWITPTDFTRVPDGQAPVTELTITITIDEIGTKHRGQLISVLAPSAGSDAARITLRAEIDDAGRIKTSIYGGDLDHGDVESIARESIRFVYLPPLRDAVGDLKPGYGNKLQGLVSTFAPAGHTDREEIANIAKKMNAMLADVDAITKSANAVQSRLRGITGGGPYEHQSSLQFADPQYERIVNTLQALAGKSSVHHLRENGLGYNNLLYIAVLLAAIETDETVPLNVLLVEEPEAHLHPQLQSLLMEYREEQSGGRTQVIATTHSAQFASSAQIERITTLHRRDPVVSPSAHSLARAELSAKNSRHLRRFLDVTKSAMLFSEAVILVEGVAEQLVVPALAQRMQKQLSQAGVSVVAVDGVSFEPFIRLFGEAGLPTRCVVVSDSDPKMLENGRWSEQSMTATKLLGYGAGTVSVELATKTFEWDLAYNNYDSRTLLEDALIEVHPRVGKRLKNESFDTPDEFADAILDAVENDKGAFAQALADQLIDHPTEYFQVPLYLRNAIVWVTSP